MNKKNGFLFLVFASALAMVLVDMLVLFFFGHSVSRLLPRLGLPGLGFIAVYGFVLGRNAGCFSPAFFDNASAKELPGRFRLIGSLPIKMIAAGVLLHALFLGGVFVNGAYLGLDTRRAPLFLAALALGMLAGTFVYVMTERLVSGTLIAHKLTRYPRDLRENRQGLKVMIIPVAVALLAVLFSASVTILGMAGSGGNPDTQTAAIIVPLVLFFFVVVALAVTLKRNNTILYSSIIEQLENLSSERKDLTRRIYVCSVDELGTIAGMVNTFCEYMGAGIRDIKDGQKELSRAGIRLDENAAVMADSITRISGAAEQVLGKTQLQLESVTMSSRAAGRIAENINSLEKSIDSQSASMSQASSAVEQMVGNISSIGSVTEKMAAQFKTVGEAAVEGSRVQKESGERIVEIVKQSQALQEANKIIATIAARTNLLAMNAAIEAAHAGDAGRGFSVVADEIRKLAENSSSESQKIGNELKQIVKSIELIVRDAGVSDKVFAEVSRRVEETEKLVVQVDNAVREQKTGAGQVMESLRAMNDITARVSDGYSEMGKGNEAMLREINALQGSAGGISTGMEEMSGDIKKINSGARDVSDLAIGVRSSIQKISAIADGFEV